MELDEMKKEVAALKVRVAELGTEAHEKRLEGRETNQIVKEMEVELSAMRNRCLQVFAEEASLKEEANQKTQEARFKEDKIKEEENRLSIADFMGKQRDFYEVLGERVEEAQKNANHSLIGFDSEVTPKAFIEWILKEEKRTNNFSNEIVFTRSTKAHYKEALLEIAKVFIQGRRVSLDLKMRPQNIIDTYLRDGLIEPRWNK